MRIDNKIPAVAIGSTTADELETLLKSQKITAKLNSNCGMRGEKLSHSVIGEITGKKDKNVIVVGGHLDSWDVGEGAHDDGAGIVQSIEVLRTFKKMGIQNNHTIRVVCFANEENGLKGGLQYGKTVKDNNEKHLFAIESDAGGFAPRGVSLEMDDEKESRSNPGQTSSFLMGFIILKVCIPEQISVPFMQWVFLLQSWFLTLNATSTSITRRKILSTRSTEENCCWALLP
ncbi:M20/M25/M40 family metallo-hydrolase [Chryseobacterium wanjuense]